MPFNLVNLTLKQKIDAIEASKKPGFSQVKYTKEIGVTQSCLSKILKNQEALKNRMVKGHLTPKSKSQKESKFPEIEEKVHVWILSTAESPRSQKCRLHHIKTSLNASLSRQPCSFKRRIAIETL